MSRRPTWWDVLERILHEYPIDDLTRGRLQAIVDLYEYLPWSVARDAALETGIDLSELRPGHHQCNSFEAKVLGGVLVYEEGEKGERIYEIRCRVCGQTGKGHILGGRLRPRSWGKGDRVVH